MICYGVFLLAVGLAAAIPSEKLHPLSDEFIQKINEKQSLWKAGRNFEIEDYELFKVLASGVKKSNREIVYAEIQDADADIPESFDSREIWPECANLIGLIRDQSRCGACWAFAAAEAMSDRICIHSNGTKKMLISSQDVLTCTGSGDGCHGGDPYDAWRAWRDNGVVTGGLYNRTDQGCKSYFLPPCDDHIDKCTDYVTTPDCLTVCDDSTLDYDAQKTYGDHIIQIRGEENMQLEILKNGPVEATFDVYEDFASYKSGIYTATYGNYIGGHAIKVIGWGVENGTKFWRIANSWNENWGENGFFRIIRGQNDASIEDGITAALPDFSRF